MKKQILLLALSTILISAVSAQDAGNGISPNMDLVAENTSTKYYAESSTYEVDSEGNITGKILSYHANGNLQEMGYLLKGEKHGEWYQYDDEGLKTSEGNFFNGEKHGVWIVWDNNGTQRVSMEYDKGKRVGIWKMFDENGNLINEKSYE